jgi:hypothetical protein
LKESVGGESYCAIAEFVVLVNMVGTYFCKKVKGDSSSSTRMIVIESALSIYIGNCPLLYPDLNLMKVSSRMMFVASRLNIVAKERS